MRGFGRTIPSEFNGVEAFYTAGRRLVSLFGLITFWFPVVFFSVAGGAFQARAEEAARSGVLFGWVLNESGEPLRGVISIPGSAMPDIESDPKTGNFRRELPPGRYVLSVQSAGYRSQTKKLRMKPGKEYRVDFRLQPVEEKQAIPQLGTIAGSVMSKDGRPLAAIISFPEAGIPDVKTDPATGVFQKELPAGKYQVSFRSQGYEQRGKKVKVSAGKEKRVEIRLSPKKGGEENDLTGEEKTGAIFLETKMLPPSGPGKVSPSEDRISGEIQLVNTFVSQMGQDLVKVGTDLYLLREKLFEAVPVGSTIQIILVNELNNIFDIRNVRVTIDEKVVLERRDEGDELDDQKEFNLYWDGVSPGSHQISVFVSVQGRAKGFIDYFQKYSIELRSSHRFDFPEGKSIILRVHCVDRGGRFDLNDRLRLEVKSGENGSGKE